MPFDAGVNASEYESCRLKTQKFLDDLMKIVVQFKCLLEGNIFYSMHFNLAKEFVPKQLNMFWCGKQVQTKVCEIGFNAGHSSMLLFLGRDDTPVDFTVFDIGHHAYTGPCLEYVKSQYKHVNIEFVHGDSTVTMPKWIKENIHCLESYDVVHVDGGHSEHCILNDMKHADLLVKERGLLIIDDTNLHHINKCVDVYVAKGYTELRLHPTILHRVLVKPTSTYTA